MIPFPMRVFWRQLCCRLTFRYAIVAGVCMWAMIVQTEYRVPGRFLFLLLPWIGVALTVLSFVFLFDHLRAWVSPEDPVRRALRRIEWCANLLVRIFVYYSLLLYANAKLDPSYPIDRKADILSISGAAVDVGSVIPYGWMEISSWKTRGAAERILIGRKEWEHFWGGERVILQVRRGFFKIPWVSRVERDEEKYSRDVLALAPTASAAWKTLAGFYLDHKQWREAAATTREYLKRYPNDYKFATEVGGTLDIGGDYADGIALLDYVTEHRPSYEVYQLLGWALSFQGNKKRAAEVLETSIPLRPDDWEVYYHLGYVYSDLGRSADAIMMFEKTLEQRPNFPEAQNQLATLRRLAGNQPRS